MSPNSSAASTAARSPRMSAQSVRRKRHGGVASAGYVSGRSSGPRRLPPVRLPEGVVEHRGDIVRRRTSLDSMSSGTRYGTNRAYALRARGPDARANPRGQGLPEAPERATLGTAVRRLDAARHVRSSAAKGRRLAFAGLAAPAPSSGWAVEARPAHPAGTTEPEHQAVRRGHAALMPWVSTSTTRPRVPKSCPSTGRSKPTMVNSICWRRSRVSARVSSPCSSAASSARATFSDAPLVEIRSPGSRDGLELARGPRQTSNCWD
jgi:hypothetical protein